MTLDFGKPLRLHNEIQNYLWGTKNDEAFIPKLIKRKVEKDVPYAELWIGAHPKASSKVFIAGEFIALNELIGKYPEQILGKYVNQKFNGKLPFLLKVLSAGMALSIQTHPNKEQAVELHKTDPVNYPDDNHKPEIAVALDGLNALVGLKPYEEISSLLEHYPFLKKIIDTKWFTREEEIPNRNNRVIEIYNKVMRLSEDPELLKLIIDEMVQAIRGKSNRTAAEELILENFSIYGYDVGLLSFLFLNLLTLKTGEAIFTQAGIPHAYLKGNIIECMANSDNVVRAGLTPKFKDIKTLIDILRYDGTKPKIMKPASNIVIYQTDAEEFILKKIVLCSDEVFDSVTGGIITIVFITKGNINIKVNCEETGVQFTGGDSVMLTSMIEEFRIAAESDCEFFVVSVPVTK